MEFHLDRHAFTLTSFADNVRTNRPLAYWLTRPVAERLAAVGFLSRQFSGPPPDFNDFCHLLNQHNVEFVVVGEQALAFYGVTRFTGVLDILIRPTEANAGRLICAMGDFGFSIEPLTVEKVIAPGSIIEMGVVPVHSCHESD